MPHGKKYKDAARRYDKEALHGVAEAIDLVKSFSSAKFDETIELAIQLGVDPRKPDQQVRGTVSLPTGTGKTARVAVFAQGDYAAEARAAGADFVGADDLVAQVEGGMMDFDVAIATPDLMAQVARLGRALGPRGLMPNPKTGTVTTDVGKASFPAADLLTNFRAVVDELQRVKPAAAKGRYIKRVAISSTMGPGVKVDPNRLKPEATEAATA
jgi:large subunit ribosomal protein L1